MQVKYIQIMVLAAVFALQYAAEHLYPQKRELNNWRNERFNLLIGMLNVSLTFLPAGLFVQGMALIETNRWGLLQQFRLPYWLGQLLAILVLDFWMYAWHRFNHSVPFLWRWHRFHHKDTNMNSTTALRFHTAELLLSYPGKALVCFLFGITYMPLLVYEIIFFIAVVFHHSNIRITQKQDAIYRTVFASPLLHRIHHSDRFAETNANFGAVFSFWDLLFRSRVNEPAAEITFGLPKEEGRPAKNEAV